MYVCGKLKAPTPTVLPSPPQQHAMASAAPAAPLSTVKDVEKDAVVQDSIVPKGTVAEKLLKHSHDADAAMKAFEGMEGQVVELTEEKSRALLRKIDLHLMPVSYHHVSQSIPSTFFFYILQIPTTSF